MTLLGYCYWLGAWKYTQCFAACRLQLWFPPSASSHPNSYLVCWRLGQLQHWFRWFGAGRSTAHKVRFHEFHVWFFCAIGPGVYASSVRTQFRFNVKDQQHKLLQKSNWFLAWTCTLPSLSVYVLPAVSRNLASDVRNLRSWWPQRILKCLDLAWMCSYPLHLRECLFTWLRVAMHHCKAAPTHHQWQISRHCDLKVPFFQIFSWFKAWRSPHAFEYHAQHEAFAFALTFASKFLKPFHAMVPANTQVCSRLRCLELRFCG